MQTDADCGLIFTTPRRDSCHRRDGGDGSLLEGHPPADRRDCHIAGHRGCRWGCAGECHGGEDAADGVGPQTEDRRQPAAEAQWGCVLACAENTARKEHRNPRSCRSRQGNRVRSCRRRRLRRPRGRSHSGCRHGLAQVGGRGSELEDAAGCCGTGVGCGDGAQAEELAAGRGGGGSSETANNAPGAGRTGCRRCPNSESGSSDRVVLMKCCASWDSSSDRTAIDDGTRTEPQRRTRRAPRRWRTPAHPQSGQRTSLN